MIFFGHIGLTLGAVRVADQTVISRNIDDTIKKIDYRYVLVGSLLPDAIDKTILFFYNNDEVRSGRYIAHSLLFVITLFIIGLVAKSLFKNNGFIILSACSFIHLMLDKMWTQMYMFLWPLYDILPKKIQNPIPAWSPSPVLPDIPEGGQIEFSLHSAKRMLLEPSVLIPEIIGAVIVLYFIISLFRNKRITTFIANGKW